MRVCLFRLLPNMRTQVKKLFGNDPITGVYVFGIVAVQFTMAYLLRDLNGSSVAFWLCAYVIGASFYFSASWIVDRTDVFRRHL